jgi:hypothetical protein
VQQIHESCPLLQTNQSSEHHWQDSAIMMVFFFPRCSLHFATSMNRYHIPRSRKQKHGRGFKNPGGKQARIFFLLNTSLLSNMMIFQL